MCRPREGDAGGDERSSLVADVRAALADLPNPDIATRLVMLHLVDGIRLGQAVQQLGDEAAQQLGGPVYRQDARRIIVAAIPLLRTAFEGRDRRVAADGSDDRSDDPKFADPVLAGARRAYHTQPLWIREADPGLAESLGYVVTHRSNPAVVKRFAKDLSGWYGPYCVVLEGEQAGDGVLLQGEIYGGGKWLGRIVWDFGFDDQGDLVVWSNGPGASPTSEFFVSANQFRQALARQLKRYFIASGVDRIYYTCPAAESYALARDEGVSWTDDSFARHSSLYNVKESARRLLDDPTVGEQSKAVLAAAVEQLDSAHPPGAARAGGSDGAGHGRSRRAIAWRRTPLPRRAPSPGAVPMGGRLTLSRRGICGPVRVRVKRGGLCGCVMRPWRGWVLMSRVRWGIGLLSGWLIIMGRLLNPVSRAVWIRMASWWRWRIGFVQLAAGLGDDSGLMPEALASTLLGLPGDAPNVDELIACVGPYVDLAVQSVLRFGRPRAPEDGVTCFEAVIKHEHDVHGRDLEPATVGHDMQRLAATFKGRLGHVVVEEARIAGRWPGLNPEQRGDFAPLLMAAAQLGNEAGQPNRVVLVLDRDGAKQRHVIELSLDTDDRVWVDFDYGVVGSRLLEDWLVSVNVEPDAEAVAHSWISRAGLPEGAPLIGDAWVLRLREDYLAVKAGRAPPYEALDSLPGNLADFVEHDPNVLNPKPLAGSPGGVDDHINEHHGHAGPRCFGEPERAEFERKIAAIRGDIKDLRAESEGVAARADHAKLEELEARVEAVGAEYEGMLARFDEKLGELGDEAPEEMSSIEIRTGGG